MAIRGEGGTLTFSREWPPPTAVPVGMLTTGAVVRIELDEPAFWSGDQVTLVAAAGLPFDVAGTGYANCPDGHAFWGGDGSQGPATLHRTGDDGAFWEVSDDADFWDSEETVGLTTAATFYVHRDQLDRLTVYGTELEALNGGATGRVTIRSEVGSTIVLAPAADIAGYNEALLAAAAAPAVMAAAEEAPLANLTTLPPVITTAGSIAEERGWRRQADLGRWVFETDPRLLDTTAIGEEFGDSSKGLIRGSGSYQAIISNRYLGPGVSNATAFLRLILLTRIGARSSARFLLTDGDDAGICQGAGTLEGAIFYETDILLGRGDLECSPDGLITLAGQFVSVGEIRLVAGDP